MQSISQNILFISQYAGYSASSRYRVYHVSEILQNKHKISCKIIPLLPANKSKIRKKFNKVLFRLLYYKYDIIFFHKNAPHNLELKILHDILKKKIILSIDDIPRFDLSSMDTNYIDMVLCGSQFLTNMFQEKGFFATTWPSVPPLRFLKQRKFNNKSQFIKIGWIGSTNLKKYVSQIIPVLDKLIQNYNFNFVVVTSKKHFYPFSSDIKNRKYIYFKEWQLDKEWDYFDDIDIIIMPLDSSNFSQAKCGFKLLQGMFRGAVPIGYYTEANARLIHNGYNGFLFKTNEELYNQLSILLSKNVNLKNYCKKSYDIIMQQGLFLENYVQKLVDLLSSL